MYHKLPALQLPAILYFSGTTCCLSYTLRFLTHLQCHQQLRLGIRSNNIDPILVHSFYLPNLFNSHRLKAGYSSAAHVALTGRPISAGISAAIGPVKYV